MEFLRLKFSQVKTSWDQLSASGRLALTLTVMLVVAVLIIVSHYAGSADLVPLPTQYPADEIARAVSTLQAQGVKAEIRGGQILVPSDKHAAALGMLAYSDALPSDGTLTFEKLLEGSDMLESETEKERRWRYALKRELEKYIRSMPGVRGASVNVNFGTKQTIRPVPQGVSAAISVETRPSRPLDKQLARAMASLVAGAVHGLTIEAVKVVDVTTGRTFDLSAAAGVYNSDYVRTVQVYESYYEARLLEQFADIRGLKVGVHVVPDLDKETEQSRTVDPTKVIGGATSERSATSTGGAAAGEVGVSPNVGSGTAGAATALADTQTEETVGRAVDYPTTVKLTEKTPGAVKEISAAISIPRSYLVDVAGLAMDGDETKVDQAAIDKVFDVEKLKIAQQAAKVLGAKDDTAVHVDWHYDLAPASALLAAASGPGVMTYVTDYGPTVGLGLLAVLALMMVYSVVRKFQPASLPAEGAATAESVGEAGLTLDSILEGVELEADVIRTSKMQEQIGNMIKEDADAVASLVKRWVAKE